LAPAERAAVLESILESAEHAIVATSLDGTIVFWNDGARRLFGHDGADVVGRENLVSLHAPDSVDRVRAMLEAARRDGASDGHLTRRHRDGSSFPTAVTITLRGDRDGTPLGFTVLARDAAAAAGGRATEELQRKNDELEEQYGRIQSANRLKSEFLANMSHELRTPLNGIIGFTELLHDEKVGDVSVEQKEFLADILTSSRHLLQLINDILDLSKVEAGKMEFHPEPVSPATVIEEVCDTLRTLAATKRIVVDVDVDTSLEDVVVDPSKLKQVLYNYLSNALKFTPEGGRIVVRVLPEGTDRFRVEVQDTGIGITAEDVAKLFNEFQQLDASAAKRYAGTGLGLALTKRIVEAQGGEVGVRSVPGEGSTFIAILPREAAGASRPADVAEPPTAAFTPGGAPLVLIVEDNERDRAWIAETLTQAGYAVDTVATGKAALARAREQAYAAIALDLLLPDMPGQKVLAELRAEGPNRATPVVIVSVLADRNRGIGFKVHDILGKPLQPATLLESLARANLKPHTPRPILVVDDDPSALKLAERTLEQIGYRSMCRTGGEDGLAAALATPPAAVVLDLVMPVMTGFEFLERFRGTRSGRSTPVIVWTSMELGAADRRRLSASAQAVVEKSRGPEALVDEIRTLVPVSAVSKEARSGR
jgi:PAS domain S-box-containing protein